MDSAKRDGVGLALSGGGYRAMLFHAGALWRLNELGWLPKLTTVSSVSGGSIAAGVLAHAWNKLYFGEDGVAENFGKEVVQPLRKLARTNLDIPVTLKAMFIPWRSAGEELARRYAKHLFGDCCLADLDPAGPNFVFTATNLQDGSLWWFFRQPGPHGQIPLATAVAASSAFPPMLSPVVIDDPHQAGHKIVLSDAGVYDNLGLDPIENQRATVLVSDAGKKMKHEDRPQRNWPMQLLRVLTVMDNQVRELRTGSLLKAYEDKQFAGTYWATYSDIANFELPDALPAPVEHTRKLAETKTRLTRMSEATQDQLINWGYAVCDAGMRRWVCPGTALRPRFPYPGSGVG
ncbi:patatin-like phospholipase family protein [Amycolatopsis vastitatis]|uniref:Patatin n=1 Tax=Amycolatopsis vastitatis TaxID=1905142 RepID=A0A229TKR3_9PSEU|nr:patatin-like phospholipase family protein [Amycolatopsis vastitatis]OXM71289.1 patatin [Amycolatopsis vastitatis]